MNFITIFFVGLSVLAGGLLGISWSLSLQAPAVVLIGVSGVFASMKLCSTQANMQACKTMGSVNVWLPAFALVALVFFIVRAYCSPVRDLGVEDLMLILPAGLLYLIAGYSVGGKAGISLRLLIAWVVIFLLLLHVGSCFLQLHRGEGYSWSMYLTGVSLSDGSNITGMYAYYGHFANFAVIAGTLCLSLAIWGKYNYGVRVLLAILALLAFGFALLAQSRSAALSLCSALLVLVFLVYVSLSKQKSKSGIGIRKIVLLLGILGCTAAAFTGFWVFGQRGTSSFEGMFESGVRIPLWAMALEQWNDYKFLGAGSRSFSYECSAYWSDGLDSGELNPEYVHNEYLQALADYGLAGFLFVLGLLFLHIILGLKQVHRLSEKFGEYGLQHGSNAMALAIAGTSGLVAMAMHICFDFPTHILPNLILVICCAVWILPLPSKRQRNSSDLVECGAKKYTTKLMALMLMILSVGAIGLGTQQLWAGLPLIENKIAKDHGAWNPASADRAMYIPALEESLQRAPQWRRYDRLGALYQVSAMRAESPQEMKKMINMAEKCYLASIERHPFNLISKLNLASLYTEQKRWDDANEVYSVMAAFSQARERRFRVHKKWGDMHLLWANDLMTKLDAKEVEIHLAEAKRLYKASYNLAHFYSRNNWVPEYTRLLVSYATFLGHENRYEEAEALFEEAKQQEGWFKMQAQTRVNVYYAKHLYAHSIYLWHQRRPQEAYGLVIEANEALQQHEKFMRGAVGEMWHEVADQVEEMIQFFKETGINSKARDL